MNLRSSFIGLFVLILLVLPVNAATDPYLQALDLFADGHTSEAVNILRVYSADKNYILSDHCAHELAKHYETSGDTEMAKAAFKRIVTEYPDSAFASSVRAQYFSNKDNKTEPSFLTKLDLAKTFYKEGDLTSAINFLSKMDTSNPEVNYYLGMSYLRRGKILEASEKIKTLIEKYPYDDLTIKAKYRIASYYRAVGMDNIADPMLFDLIDTKPDSESATSAIFDLGFDLYARSDFKGSYNIFSKISKKAAKKDYSRALFWKAKSAQKMGQISEYCGVLDTITNEAPWTYYGLRAFQSSSASFLPAYQEQSDQMINRIRAFVSKDRHFQKFMYLYDLGLLNQATIEAHAIIDNKLATVCEAFVIYRQNDFRKAINIAERRDSADEYLDWLILELSYPKGFEKEVIETSKTFNLDPFLLFALIREESRFDPKALSRVNASGLTQIMPRTGRIIAKQHNIKGYKTVSLLDPKLNIHMGASYLSDMIRLHKGDVFLALAAYNAGPGNVRKWIRKRGYSDTDEFVENIPLKETRHYVQKVMGSYWQYRRLYEK